MSGCDQSDDRSDRGSDQMNRKFLNERASSSRSGALGAL